MTRLEPRDAQLRTERQRSVEPCLAAVGPAHFDCAHCRALGNAKVRFRWIEGIESSAELDLPQQTNARAEVDDESRAYSEAIRDIVAQIDDQAAPRSEIVAIDKRKAERWRTDDVEITISQPVSQETAGIQRPEAGIVPPAGDMTADPAPSPPQPPPIASRKPPSNRAAPPCAT